MPPTRTSATSLLERSRSLVTAIEQPQSPNAEVDTVAALCDLAQRDDWNEADLGLVDFFAKRIDISGKLWAAYSAGGRKKSDQLISEPPVLELATAIVCRALFSEVGRKRPRGEILKRFNTLFKCADLSSDACLSPESEIGAEIEQVWKRVVADASSDTGIQITAPIHGENKQGSTTTIPLTVLFHEGPIARAYLETLYAMGFRPQKIIQLIAAKDVATKAPVGRWLPRSWRASYAYKIQRQRIHHWPKRIAARHRDLYQAIVGAVARDFDFPESTVEAANALRKLTIFSDRVDPVLTEGLSDPSLLSYLTKEPESAILYTGGGIVPAGMLAIPQLKFIHVHPGHLPQIRGADCALWSPLLTGHPSATAFYMAPGIDTGDVIMPRWLPRPRFDQPAVPAVDPQTRYRAVYAFLDPWVRAFVLRELLATHSAFLDLESAPQQVADGTTFHFMHPRLREAALASSLTA